MIFLIAAIEYTRASTDHQEYSVGDQHKFNSEWAAKNNYKILKTYSDDGISGGTVAKRPGFLQMIEDITAGRLSDIKALLIWDSFRFARNMVEFLTYKQMIRQHGISVIAVSEPMVQDEDAQLYIDAINGASGELYLRKLSKDSKRGIRAKVVDRKEHLGFAPFGYRMDRNARQLVIIDEEADWVRYIFQQVIDGVPYLQIAKTLNESGCKTRKGYNWTNTQICYTLNNRTYCGQLEVTLDGQHGIYEGKHPPIIDKEMFEQVQKIMEERKAKHKRYQRSTNQYVHWLSGLMRCPYCGGSLSHGKGAGGRKPRYRCNNAMNGSKCPNLSVRVEIVENLIFETLQSVYDNPEKYYTLHLTTPQPKSIVDYDAEIKKLKNQLSRAKKAYIEEIDTLEEYRENKVRLTAAIEQLEARRVTLQQPAADPAEFQERCLSALSLLQSDLPMDQKAATSHALIEKILCDNVNKEITVYFYA